ncbi:MAG TPA: fumarylacetoacetate hydrolase family protein [Gammaproteobacteria bacterium]|nr:fumarylacetoacetate hydrolase family protein [Gammaproteobacteria bacterium]
MRFLSFSVGEYASFGAVKDDGIVDVGKLLASSGAQFAAGRPTLGAALRAGALPRALELASAREPSVALDEIRYLPTVPDPEKIVCIGVNYLNRNAEYKDAEPPPKYPSVFMRTPGSLVGHLEPIVRPRESEQLDYEGEIALVIGTEGRRIAERDAWRHVAGLSLINEGSVRDWLRHSKFNVTPGKNFERSGAFGPWLVTADEFRDGQEFHLTTRVNGEVRQDDTTASLIFSFARLIAYLSSFMRLVPGDVIATGTPTGAGARFDPPRYLKAGDVVEVQVPGIGMLRNPIVDEQAIVSESTRA